MVKFADKTIHIGGSTATSATCACTGRGERERNTIQGHMYLVSFRRWLRNNTVPHLYFVLARNSHVGNEERDEVWRYVVKHGVLNVHLRHHL